MITDWIMNLFWRTPQAEMRRGQDTEMDAPPPYETSREDLAATYWPPLFLRNRGLGYNTTLVLLPNSTAKLCSEVAWEAEGFMSVRDIPRLMREGLYWEQANVPECERYFLTGKQSIPANARQTGWAYARQFFLRGSGDDPQWNVNLGVYAREIQVLSEFRVDHLSFDNVRTTGACNRNGRTIYAFDAVETGINFNAIYDDMPLKGLWPWPKTSESEIDYELINYN